MRFVDALTEVRRKMGILFLNRSDIEYLCRKVVSENQEVFDRLGKSITNQ